MSIIRNKTANLAQRQHLPVSDEVKAKWAQAINDPRPAFKHGNSLVEQTVVEQQKKKKSIIFIKNYGYHMIYVYHKQITTKLAY